MSTSRVSKKFLNAVAATVGHDGYSISERDRLSYSRDANFRSAISAKFGIRENFAEIIVWPKSSIELATLIRLAKEFDYHVVPYGGGSGVCRGTLVSEKSILIDLKRLNTIHKLDGRQLILDADAGLYGLPLEKWLNRRKYTLGHFPSSILVATLGGYLAARSAGQTSSRYGKIEDMILDLEFVDGHGKIHRTGDVSRSLGLNFTQALVGSEGTLGLITRARLKIHPKPEHRILRAWRFPDLAAGTEAMRRIMQVGLKPDVMRLYDEIDTLFTLSNKNSNDLKNSGLVSGVLKNLTHGMLKTLQREALPMVLQLPRTLNSALRGLSSECLFILMLEGEQILIERDLRIIQDILLTCGAQKQPQVLAEDWYEHRYSVAFKATKIFESGGFTDTMEVSTTWDRILPLYQAVATALSSKAVVMAHISHAYIDGAAIYFTFVGRISSYKSTLARYDDIWETALSAVQEAGGVVSHHHGIGKLKASHIRKEWGDAIEIYAKLKQQWDPYGLFNPGVLIPDTQPILNKSKKAAS